MNAIALKNQAWHQKTARILGRVALYVLLLLYAVWVLAPFLIIIIVSFEPDVQMMREGFVWIPDWSLEGYTMLFDPENEFIDMLGNGFVNSLWQTLIPTVGGLFVGQEVARALKLKSTARLPWQASRWSSAAAGRLPSTASADRDRALRARILPCRRLR